jgi:hypothetical protein
MVADTTKVAYLEELRFAKERQWTVAIAAITFIAGAFHMAHTVKPPLAPWEKLVATGLIGIVGVGACWLLWEFQRHLHDTRLAIDGSDSTPWRGSNVVIGLGFALLISAAAVSWSLWR